MSPFQESPAGTSQSFRLENEAETLALAGALSRNVRPGDVILLQGDLGAGKTAFARAFIRSYTGNQTEDVPSPTFTLLQTYNDGPSPVWHFDLYRLKDPDEIYELGWEDGLGSAIMLIEWPDKLGSLLPSNVMTITLQTLPGQPEARLATILDQRTSK